MNLPVNKPYGCHNRQPFPPDIAARFKDTCHYTHTDLGRADVRCHGCKHRKPDVADLSVFAQSSSSFEDAADWIVKQLEKGTSK